MITLDNSGSMAFNFHESYGVLTDDNAQFELRRCSSPDYSDLTGSWIQGGTADFRNNNRCIYRGNDGNYYYSTTRSVVYSPRLYISGSWYAQRSSDVNPVYYNPRVTYTPRVDASGNPLVPSDGIVWVSNQSSAAFQYTAYRNDTNNTIRTHHSMFASNPSVTGYTSIYNIGYHWRIPQHTTYTSTSGTTPGFTYSYCSNVVSAPAEGLQMGCASGARTDVTVTRGGSGSITLPAGHGRTDCTGDTCTNAQEVANIMNWYRYYAFRAPAVATAIGQAIANPDYDKTLRLGYLSINRRNNSTISAINQTPGIDTGNTGLLRGVRPHERGSASTQQLYTWLYDQDGTQNRNSNAGADATFNSTGNRSHAPYGGTPLHNATTRVANYYRVGTNAVENPWATNPATTSSTSNPEMSCRRSFNLLFSDGAWNSGTSTIAGLDYDNTDGPTFSRTLANGNTESFNYLRHGVNTVAGRKLYIPFPSTGTGGLADLTANYFWHTDFRTGLVNNIQTRPGQPTFWQNMSTYTVGYLIRPSGDVPGATSGLTFNQINQYQTQYATSGYAGATKPTWVTGDLNNATASNDQDRVDDFIQAGYTGGGKGFSARSAKDVRSIFDTIIAEILSASGKDAGVAVGSGGTDTSTLAGRLKYNVTYRTLDNSGEIIAQELDAAGKVVDTKWTASNLIPAHGSRRVFSMSGVTTPIEFIGRFDSLPLDVRNALKTGTDANRIADDASFVNYLRGLDPVADPTAKLFRQRASTLGAMVNPPSIYMGGQRDYAYDLEGSVEGSSSYGDYADRKRGYPASLFVATNAGMMHALNADLGNELAAFMPRRSLKRMLNYADEAYNFEYTLDGPLSQHDIYDRNVPISGASEAWKRWRHLGVGTGGRGEPLIYAVNSPIKPGTTPNRIPDRADFLWETGPELVNTSDLAMGYITNPARSGQTENGEWVVVVNNGHYNGQTDGSDAGLIVLNALNGDVLKRIPLPGGYSAGRGLSGVTLVRNSDKRIVAAYAGDANGNLWRFNLKGPSTNWSVSYSKPVFTTANNRPIYGAPAWQAHPKGGTIVVVATGIMLEDSDLDDTATRESIYGIWDPTVIGDDDEFPFQTVTQLDLLMQEVMTSTGETEGGNTFYKISKNKIDWDTHRGWRMQLGHTQTGERSIAEVQNLQTSVVISTTVLSRPADSDAEMCTVSDLPGNYIYVLNALEASSRKSFDVDGDGKLDEFSVGFYPSGGFSRGVAVVKQVVPAPDLPPDPTDPTDPTPDPTDPVVTKTDAERKDESKDEGSGESEVTPQKCKNTKAIAIGTEDPTGTLGVYCPITGWSRTQYQLSAPPGL